MTDSVTGLKNPYGTYKQLVRLLYISGLILMKGRQEPYIERAARRVRRHGLLLLAQAKSDIDMKEDRQQLLRDLRQAAEYLHKCQLLEHALPDFVETCGCAEREVLALIEALGGGWSERMFPMLDAKKQMLTQPKAGLITEPKRNRQT